jgi:hypothetical protein
MLKAEASLMWLALLRLELEVGVLISVYDQHFPDSLTAKLGLANHGEESEDATVMGRLMQSPCSFITPTSVIHACCVRPLGGSKVPINQRCT